MNMTNSDFEAIEKALNLLPKNEEFDALSKEQQDIIVNAETVMIKLYRKKKNLNVKVRDYYRVKRAEDKGYGRGDGYMRKTEDYWSIHSKYGVECNCSTYEEAKDYLKDYQDNVDYPVWIKKHREKKQ